jgi:hypothetical protein
MNKKKNKILSWFNRVSSIHKFHKLIQIIHMIQIVLIMLIFQTIKIKINQQYLSDN